MAEKNLYWTPVCGSSEEDAFWSYSLTVNTSNPDFTRCFQETALVWGPCGLLWIAAPFYIFYLSGQKILHPLTAASKLNAAKVVLSVLLTLISVAQLVNQIDQHPNDPPSSWIAHAVYALTFVLVTFLMRMEYCRGQHSSGILFFFWLILVIVNIVPLRSQVSDRKQGLAVDEFEFAAFCGFYALVALEFVLHLCADLEAQRPAAVTSWKSERRPLLSDSMEDSSTVEQLGVAKKPSPELTASFLSRLTFTWISGLLVLGYKKALSGDQLYSLRRDGLSVTNVKRFFKAWRTSSRVKESEQVVFVPYGDDSDMDLEEERDPRYSRKNWQCDSSLLYALCRSQGLLFFILVFCELGNVALTFLRPAVLALLITFVKNGDPIMWHGYLYAAILFTLTVSRGIVDQHLFWGRIIVYMRIRSSLTAAIYRKSLMLASSERKNYSVGEIVNLLSVDAPKVAELAFQLYNLLTAPMHIIVAVAMLWNYLGPSSLAGVATTVLLSVVNVALVAKVRKLQVLQMKFKDKRLKLTNEILNGIRVLKLYAWEKAFQGKLESIRKSEIGYILRSAFYVAGMAISINCAPTLYTVASFTIFVLAYRDNMLSAQVAFVSLSLVGALARPLSNLPSSISSCAQALVSTKRVEDFLNKTELDRTNVTNKVSDHVVSIRSGTFSWDDTDEAPSALKDVNIGIKAGSLTAVVGQVGSGKSSLLAAIMGDMHKTSGRVNVLGKVAVVPQEAWILNQSLRSNVLFTKTDNERRYRKVIEACALEPDIDMLPEGDETEIGEKGINLSGGQKQRVSLARAVYQDEDIYLLDDPLSAVDVHVGKHIFDKVIGPTGVLQNKTRILVTHGLTHLSKVDHVIVMTNAKVSEQGTYQELLKHDGAFAELVRTYLVENEDSDDLDPQDKEFLDELRRLSESSGQESHSEDARTSSGEASRKHLRKRKGSGLKKVAPVPETKLAPPKAPPKGKKLISAEHYESGSVNFSVALSYLRAMGNMALVGCMFTFATQIAFDLGSNIWLSEWSKDSDLAADVPQNPNLPTLRVGIYGGLGAGKTLAILGQTMTLALACTTAARLLHERLLTAIMKAPVSFFDTTPTGRILNRFSQDVNTLDWQLRSATDICLRGVSGIITTIVAISYTAPIFLALAAPLAVAYYFIQRFYVMSSNQMRRLVSVRSSPLYQHFGESITGASSIRAYRCTEEYTIKSDIAMDKVMQVWYLRMLANRWLTVWLEVLGALVVLFTAIYAVVARDSTSAGLVGLSVSYAFEVTDRLSFLVKNTSDLETNIVCVERISEYSNVASEAPWVIPSEAPPRRWPSKGRVTFSNYSTRYRPGLDLVLRQISCDMGEGQKIGVVGRTGAGKTSMTIGLFRLIEPAEGQITIDQVNTSRIGLHDLRSKLTIIPQDPVLFSGTLRFNLDPFECVTDGDLWEALGHAHLRDFVMSLPARLDYECGESGHNLSFGQRQLVCLARALLRRTKILILDEATAAVDMETDALIQNTIRTEFRECSVITIAHRVNTVLDYDRIMVLDKGAICEYDTPTKLLKQTDSMFYGMCKDAGVL